MLSVGSSGGLTALRKRRRNFKLRRQMRLDPTARKFALSLSLSFSFCNPVTRANLGHPPNEREIKGLGMTAITLSA